MRDGNKEIQERENCPVRKTDCKNIENTYEGYDSETWKCEVCGEFFILYYDEMQ